MRFRQALAELDARQPERMVPDLTRIRALADLLNEPQLAYPSVHVTGTNGKTTTARLTGRVLCAHGLTAGVYTSPHLSSVTERIALCDEPISEDEFAEEYERLLPYLAEVDRRGEPVTYFEALTALAYLWFADKPVGVGVFEVGMGGTWDATNLVAGDVAVLCPIALDHPELGSTITEVATEKAGIIKPGKLAVVREQPPEAYGVVRDRAREVGATLLVEGRDWELAGRLQGVGGQVLSVRGLHETYRDLRLALFGSHTARNVAAAVVAAEALIDRPLKQEILADALTGAATPGRLEVVGRHPLVVLDGAHNPAGARALAQALPEAFSWDDLHVVLAASSNKDVEGIACELGALSPLTVVPTRNSSARSAPAQRVAEAVRSAGLVATEPRKSVEEAIDAARSAAGPTDLILITGSLYTVADARRALVT